MALLKQGADPATIIIREQQEAALPTIISPEKKEKLSKAACKRLRKKQRGSAQKTNQRALL